MNENEILGFDPTSLSVFNEPEAQKSAGNPLIYKTQPANSKSEDGVYRATIKVIYSPQNLKASVLEQQSYAMQDANGWFTVVSSLAATSAGALIASIASSSSVYSASTPR